MEGYAKLARLMGEFPEVALFRRFGALNAQNLLYMQAELTELEATLLEIEQKNTASSISVRARYSRDWWSLQRAASEDAEDGNDGEQWRLVVKIRDKLQNYNNALWQQCQIAQLQLPQGPDSGDLDFLRQWMDRVTMGNVHLLGQDGTTWSSPDLLPDLIALHPRTPESPFADWASNGFIRWYQRNISHRRLIWKIRLQEPDNKPHLRGSVNYADGRIYSITRHLTTIIACLIPVISIVILYFVPTIGARLGAIGGLTAGFAFCLGRFTGAKLSDIFAATAAYVAVCVVFVGSTSVLNAPPTPTVCNCTISR